MHRYLLCLAGILLALPLLGLTTLAFRVPITISVVGYLFGCWLAVAGLISAPWNEKYVLVALSGLIAAALIAGTRLLAVVANQTASSFRVITLPQGKETRWVNVLIDEQDTILFGETLFHYVGGDSSAEHENIDSALPAAYTKMRAAYGVFPSPVASTYLNLQLPVAFDAVIIEPEINRQPQVAVIFLHGYMGNVAAQCWEIAQAVNRFGSVTVCPSTDWTGQWWQPQAKAILAATFAYLREQGVEKFYLGGFSNGGFGIGRLAAELKNERGLSGLFFINGITDASSIRATGLPSLIIQGTQDERVPVTGVRQIAADVGDLATYFEVDGDHFMIMKKPEPVQSAISDWLEINEPLSLDK